MRILLKSWINIVKDRKYIIAAITITTRRFGPSGSSKKKNIALEHAIDVIPKISNEVFFDLKYIIGWSEIFLTH